MNKLIDHTLLKAYASMAEIKTLCEEAIKFKFKSVCVNPVYVKDAKELLKGSDVLVCTVIGFPLGTSTSATKAFETSDAILHGADEIDMVINMGALKDGNVALVESDIKAVVDAAKGKLVKVIIETCYLTDDEKKLACKAAQNAKAQFVKTSTGFGTGGATVADVQLMKETVPNMEVKASGGVRNLNDVELMVKAGATRIGTSNGVAIVNGNTAKQDY